MTLAAHRLTTNADPTRTIGVRARWIADVTRRYRNLMAAIRVSIVDRDVLGLAGPQPLFGLAATPADPADFVFLRDPQKMDAFMGWLDTQEAASVLEIIPGPAAGPEPWSNQYVRSSYQRGLANGLARLKRKGVDVPQTVLPGRANIIGIFNQPFHQERVQLIYQRVFSELDGVTKAMDAQISEVLASGMIEGVGPEEMARRMVDRVDKIGLTRSKLVARTEVVETYNQAAVGEYSRASAIIGEEILVEWWTSQDERVRSSHRRRHGKVFTQEEFLQLIGEPNCRCSGLPYIESVDGEATLSSASTFRRAA